MNNISFTEFSKSVYYTETKIVIPLLNLRLNKTEFMKNGKYISDLFNLKLIELYKLNIKKFK